MCCVFILISQVKIRALHGDEDCEFIIFRVPVAEVGRFASSQTSEVRLPGRAVRRRGYRELGRPGVQDVLRGRLHLHRRAGSVHLELHASWLNHFIESSLTRSPIISNNPLSGLLCDPLQEQDDALQQSRLSNCDDDDDGRLLVRFS